MKPQNCQQEKVFAPARQKFNSLCQDLESASMLAMTHSEVELWLQIEGAKLLQELYQDHLNLRSITEIKAESVEGADGIRRTPQRIARRLLMTVFGPVTVSRLRYASPGQCSLCPMDSELNLPLVKYSYGLQRILAAEVARSSFDEALTALNRYCAGHIPKRQAEEVVYQASCDFDAFYAQLSYASAEEKSVAVSLQILSLDAKGIVMLPEDLRESTQKAAQSHKLSKRSSRGEKKNRKRMATVAAVYSQAPYPQTPSQVARGCYPQDEKTARPKPIGKRVWASVEKEVRTVVDEIFTEATRQDPNKERQWVALVDGNKDQIRHLKTAARQQQVKLSIVLDVIHVLEYLWKAAYVFYPEGSLAAQDWVTEQFFRILQGKSSRVAGAMRRKATRTELSQEARRNVDKCAQYLLNNKPYLRYHVFLNAGYPIATGVIEGACRYLVKDRMDRTGARWSLKGAEAVLKLRALLTCGDFDAYWTFHEQQQKLRHYASVRKILSVPCRPCRKVEKSHEYLHEAS